MIWQLFPHRVQLSNLIKINWGPDRKRLYLLLFFPDSCVFQTVFSQLYYSNKYFSKLYFSKLHISKLYYSWLYFSNFVCLSSHSKNGITDACSTVDCCPLLTICPRCWYQRLPLDAAAIAQCGSCNWEWDLVFKAILSQSVTFTF